MTLSASRLSWLATLYVAQGLPFGFQATALPVQLRQAGMSLSGLGLLGVLALPWALKPLWAPWVDASDPLGLGRRRSWLLLMQTAQILTCLAAATLDAETDTQALLGCVLAMNLWAATQDIATDGLAVDMLDGGALGLGNSAQVAGYKVGMMLGGGGLVWLAGAWGWSALFGGMAAIQALAMAAAWRLGGEEHRGGGSRTPDVARPRVSFLDVWRTLQRALRAPGQGAVLALIATYKFGETMVDVLWKPLLVDRGVSVAAIGLWVGGVGMAAGLLGSVAGGWAWGRWGLRRALAATLALRVLPLAAMVALAATTSAELSLVALATVSVAEHVAGGALTTVVFATMMAHVDRRIGASHYTALAAVEVACKAPAAWLAGPLADHLGYAPTMTAGVVLAAGVLAVVPQLGQGRGAGPQGDEIEPHPSGGSGG